MGSGLKNGVPDRTAPVARYRPDGQQIGYQQARPNDIRNTPGFSFTGMHDPGQTYQQAMFKDNQTGQRMDSTGAARALIGQQPMINQSSMLGSGVTSGQTAAIDFMGMDGAGLAKLMNRSPFAAQSAGLLIGGTGQWDNQLAKARADAAQKAFAMQRKS